jgi:hypothetical protein
MDLNLHLAERKRLALERLDDRRERREFPAFDVDLRPPARSSEKPRKIMLEAIVDDTFQISINSCPSSRIIPCNEYSFGSAPWWSTAPILYGKKWARELTCASPRSSGPHCETEKSNPEVK